MNASLTICTAPLHYIPPCIAYRLPYMMYACCVLNESCLLAGDFKWQIDLYVGDRLDMV